MSTKSTLPRSVEPPCCTCLLPSSISHDPGYFFEVVMPFWLIFKGFKPEVYR